jgi:CBS domain containing-hemolysin-like protein
MLPKGFSFQTFNDGPALMVGGRVVADIVPLGDGRFRVEGTVRIDEVGEALGVELEHPDVDSVSGLVLDLLGHLPIVGEAVEYDHVRFEVTRVESHGVGEALVSHVPPPGAPDDDV